MTLSQKQQRFTEMVGQLILWAAGQGFGLTFGDAWRSPEEARRLAAAGKGSPNSLHCLRLAVDLNLFRGGVYLTATEDYKPLGEYWEGLGGSWGGRFKDGNHFSLEHEGRR